jgi:DNA mismatch repair protein MutL
VSCPNVKEGAIAFGQKAESLYDITSKIKAKARQPVIMKLSPNVTDIGEMAKAAEAAGADAISLINTITGMKIDIHKRAFVLANKTGGLSPEQDRFPVRAENKNDDGGDSFFVDNREKTAHTDSIQGIGLTKQSHISGKILGAPPKETDTKTHGIIKSKDQIIVEKPEQLNFFDEKILTREAKQEYRIIGQVFDTYWIIEYRDKMLMIDQHAAHEKVKYEQILSKVENNEVYTQVLTPPVVISVTPKEAALISSYEQYFKELGFEIEDFGMNAFAVRGVPLDLFGHDIKSLFEEVLTQMVESPVRGVPQIIREKIASMACKAAVKGNNPLTYKEADKLIEQLLELDNPYNCPHGRPTIISMSKYEVEKKFKRIV